MMNIEKTRAFDEVAIEHKIEEIQIQKAQEEYKLSEDKDFI